MSETDYRRLSVREKEARNRQHEPPTRCPVCEMGVQPDDLLAHLAGRCQGRPQPHLRSRWVTYREALKLGVSRSTLMRWANDGRVRKTGEIGNRRYLLRDLIKCISVRKAAPRRGSADKQLTKPRRNEPSLRMGQPIETELAKRLRAYAEQVGGFAAAGRKLDIPCDTLRRAAAGEKVRRGTMVLIDRQITELTTR